MRIKSHDQAMKAIAFICMLVAMAACFAAMMQVTPCVCSSEKNAADQRWFVLRLETPPEVMQTKAKSSKKAKPSFYGVSHVKTWGKVYEPVLQKLPRSASQISYPLKGAAAEEFASIHKEAKRLEVPTIDSNLQQLTLSAKNVYDPATDRNPSKNMPKHTGVQKDDKWWSFESYHGSAAHGGDSWWQHDHTNRGY
ncbi:hypothetical protein GUITHDRAFT_104595 [Guillardia theta CCMP2712]|uniref:Uncharacterized protein n=1 Tax=Guillardia theta (strain CCMP2712) TaxID=905079 RepID=L1JN67_GUITC|nr:hypothetical protein GUITHDRAFT_104595 [Guillardia theta CCMP2712]EKX49635.1 hypothetical protein GUITHDRAFT_104595 [Guillardia theta CCMP2712]|eukprot:XP_005836615.1 hypothetical protein GUITHDRAFT_104595 [Guillardia theta CCMP2712]